MSLLDACEEIRKAKLAYQMPKKNFNFSIRKCFFLGTILCLAIEKSVKNNKSIDFMKRIIFQFLFLSVLSALDTLGRNTSDVKIFSKAKNPNFDRLSKHLKQNFPIPAICETHSAISHMIILQANDRNIGKHKTRNVLVNCEQGKLN